MRRYAYLFDVLITVYIWLVIFMAIGNVDSERVGLLGSVLSVPWLFHLGYAFGLPLLSQLISEYGAVYGTFKWIVNFLCGVIYYIFHLRTKAVGFKNGIHQLSGCYKATGR